MFFSLLYPRKQIHQCRDCRPYMYKDKFIYNTHIYALLIMLVCEGRSSFLHLMQPCPIVVQLSSDIQFVYIWSILTVHRSLLAVIKCPPITRPPLSHVKQTTYNRTVKESHDFFSIQNRSTETSLFTGAQTKQKW